MTSSSAGLTYTTTSVVARSTMVKTVVSGAATRALVPGPLAARAALPTRARDTAVTEVHSNV